MKKKTIAENYNWIWLVLLLLFIIIAGRLTRDTDSEQEVQDKNFSGLSNNPRYSIYKTQIVIDNYEMSP